MNSILISVHPEWVAEILNGNKRLEVRLTVPKEVYINNPDGTVSLRDVYVYCTKADKFGRTLWQYKEGGGYYIDDRSHNPFDIQLGGRIPAKFSLEYCVQLPILHDYNKHCAETVQAEKEALEAACLTREQLDAYRKGGIAWGWSIKDLQVFDRPMELGEFSVFCKNYIDCENIFCDKDNCRKGNIPLTRPPQSWQFVEAGQ